MIKQTIDELRKIKDAMIGYDDFTQDDLFAIDKAIIACEQLRKARKKAKRWKRKYLRLMEICEKIKSDPSKECNYCVHLDNGINDFFCEECCHNYINKFKPNTKGEPDERPTNRKSNGWY